MCLGIRQWAKELIEQAQFRWHRLQLQRQVHRQGGDYATYFDTQLRRTFSKRNAALPERARSLIDATARTIDLTDTAVLCVGCRNIAEIEHFRSKGARHVVGIDLYSTHRNILVMDMHAMTFEPASFDVVYSSHSLEHSIETQQAAAEFVRVLRPGGAIVIEVPVNYEERGADLVDFGSLDNLLALFAPHMDKVLWLEQQDTPTNTLRVIFHVRNQSEELAANAPEKDVTAMKNFRLNLGLRRRWHLLTHAGLNALTVGLHTRPGRLFFQRELCWLLGVDDDWLQQTAAEYRACPAAWRLLRVHKRVVLETEW
jgi:SAM-dependent methyltransferase